MIQSAPNCLCKTSFRIPTLLHTTTFQPIRRVQARDFIRSDEIGRCRVPNGQQATYLNGLTARGERGTAQNSTTIMPDRHTRASPLASVAASLCTAGRGDLASFPVAARRSPRLAARTGASVALNS